MSSPLKSLSQFKPSLTVIVLGWCSFKFMSDNPKQPQSQFQMITITRNKNILYICKNSLILRIFLVIMKFNLVQMKTAGSKGFEIQNVLNVTIKKSLISGDYNFKIRALDLTWTSLFLDIQLNIPNWLHDIVFSVRNHSECMILHLIS